MTLSVENSIFTITLSAISTVALALLMLMLGQKIKNHAKFLQAYCIPAPVIGGVLFAIFNLILHQTGAAEIVMNTTYQSDMQNLFFTSVGFTATFALMKKGGNRLVKYFVMAAILAVLQGAVGVLVAKGIGAEEWLGIMCGPAALSGGHGNAAAFGEMLDKMGHNATVVGMAAATFGLVTGGFFGGPIAERLIRKKNLTPATSLDATLVAEGKEDTNAKPVTGAAIFSHVALMATLLAVGLLFKSLIKEAFSLSLPDYAVPAVLACLTANLNERTHWFDVNPAIMSGLQDFTLGVFLSLAMVSLKLWQLIDLAIPMIVILVIGLVVTLLYIYFFVFPICGKDYDAAIMCAGMTGHGLGASPTGFANMDSVTKKYGRSEISYLCVTVVGGILMDWVLLIVNTTLVNLFG